KIDHMMRVFIKPWVQRRHGLATYHELIERFQRISEQSDITDRALHLIDDIFYPSTGWINHYFHKIDTGVYGIHPLIMEAYTYIVSKSKTYFYAADVSYPLSYFLSMLTQECARTWLYC